MRLIRVFNTETATEPLHQAQGNTAKLHGQIGLLMVLGWIFWLVGSAMMGSS
jgi:hypothetical protein